MTDASLPPGAPFEGAVAVVTGGGSGIGRALAEALAARGARVAVADIDAGAAGEVARALGGSARSYACDVADRASLEVLADAVRRDFGGSDFVFANAGVFALGPLPEASPEGIDWLLDVNVKGVAHTVTAFAPMLRAAAAQGRPARFVLTGSENSVGLPSVGVNTLYTATKHAVLGLADGLRRDLAGSGVGVSILCPGPVNTRLWDSGRARPDRYGGAAEAEPAFAERARRAFDTYGQAPAATAAICLDAVAEDRFLIIADPAVRAIADRRREEVDAALDRINARLAAASD